MNEWVDAICAHLNLRDQSDSSTVPNLYTVGHNPPVVTSPPSHYGSMPLSTSPSPGPGPPIRNIPSPSFFPSQYGTLSAIHMGSGISTATYGSTSPLPGRGPPPSPPPPYSGVCYCCILHVIVIMSVYYKQSIHCNNNNNNNIVCDMLLESKLYQ